MASTSPHPSAVRLGFPSPFLRRGGFHPAQCSARRRQRYNTRPSQGLAFTTSCAPSVSGSRTPVLEAACRLALWSPATTWHVDLPRARGYSGSGPLSLVNEWGNASAQRLGGVRLTALLSLFVLLIPTHAAATEPSSPWDNSPAVTPPPQPPPAPATPAHGEVAASYGFAGGGTDWSGDAVGYGMLTLGFRLWGTITPFVGVALGYGVVNERLLTRLTVGLELGHTFAERFRPRIYVAFVHQHEESLAAVAQEPVGWLLGVGTAIRHRAGVHAGVGFDYIFRQRAKYDLGVGPDVSIDWFDPGYSSGPEYYYVAGIVLTAHARLF